MKIFIFLFMIIVLTSLIILESNNLQISEKEDIKIFKNELKNWANEIYLNIQQITGQTIRMDWLP